MVALMQYPQSWYIGLEWTDLSLFLFILENFICLFEFVGVYYFLFLWPYVVFTSSFYPPLPFST